MPIDVLKVSLLHSVTPPEAVPKGASLLEKPVRGRAYLICADPAGFGGSGDNSAVTVWDATERREVAMWEGREDPGRFSERLLNLQRFFNNGLLAVESNAAACIAMLKDKGARNLLWTDRNHPGWYATEKRVQEGEARLVRMLRERELTIKSKPLLHQLLNYDGNRGKRSTNSDGTTHHFDLARTAVMAADVLSRRRFTSDETPLPTQDYAPSDEARVTIADLDRYKHQERAAARNPFKPIAREWT
jgi:glycine/D-amino acid oxidase-like deaminating enzyme